MKNNSNHLLHSFEFQRTLAILAAALALASPAYANTKNETTSFGFMKSYNTDEVTQNTRVSRDDISPSDPESIRQYSKTLATDATIYGLPSALQYREMYKQAIDKSSSRYVGFNKFYHDRDLAGPDYEAFQAPNSDTLYSSAWLDLSGGPILIKIPDCELKYFTLQLLDMYSNSSNIGTRTYGNKSQNYLIVPPDWKGKASDDVTVFKVATPYVWILMRVFAQEESEIAMARRFQDDVKIIPTREAMSNIDFPPPNTDNPLAFFQILDFILRTNGHPNSEESMIYRYCSIGVGCKEPFDQSRLSKDVIDGLTAGFSDATKMIARSTSKLGTSTGTGWNVNQKGRYGFNYFNRAVINYVGLGANVSEENYSFSTFVDNRNIKLDGSKGNYKITFKTQPPVDGFWSLTLYESTNFHLYDNKINRYSLSNRTSNLKFDKDGSITINIQHNEPGNFNNWLPAPNGPFILTIRNYLPKQELLAGDWLPPSVEYVTFDR